MGHEPFAVHPRGGMAHPLRMRMKPVTRAGEQAASRWSLGANSAPFQGPIARGQGEQPSVRAGAPVRPGEWFRDRSRRYIAWDTRLILSPRVPHIIISGWFSQLSRTTPHRCPKLGWNIKIASRTQNRAHRIAPRSLSATTRAHRQTRMNVARPDKATKKAPATRDGRSAPSPEARQICKQNG